MINDDFEPRECACCGEMIVEFFDICPICKWQNDPLQNDNPNYGGGANELSLNQAKAEWEKKNNLL